MTILRVLVGLILVGGLVGIAFAGLREKPPPRTEVQLGTVKKAALVQTVTGAGKVQPATTVKISSNLSGDLIELLVKEGDQVKRGQVLGRIDKRRFEAAAKQSQAALNAAKSEAQASQVDADRLAAEAGRVEALVAKGLAAKAELDRAVSDRDAALARVAAMRDRAVQAAASLDEAANNVAKTTLLSPIDGTVIELTREIGERVRGSDFSEDVVMTLAALATMEVKIEVSEHEVVHLKLGQRADVKVDALEGQTYEGSVYEIAQKALVRSPGTDAETTTFPVTVALTARPVGVLPGMNAEVRVVSDSREAALVVPVQAVTVRPEKLLKDRPEQAEGQGLKAPKVAADAFAKVVFVVDGEKKVALRRVRTGISSDTDIEILEGLKEGDQIVEGPYRVLAKDLKEGDLVEEASEGGKGMFGGGPKRGGG